MQASIQSAINRYMVAVDHADGEPLQLLIPFSPSSTVSDLLDEVLKRSTKQGLAFQRNDARLHFGSTSGPILDDEDTLGDTIISPASETIHVTFAVSEKAGMIAVEDAVRQSAANNMLNSFKIRIITPSLAQKSTTGLIPFLCNGKLFNGETTLRDIRAEILNHLGWSAESETSVVKHGECNCTFAGNVNTRELLDRPNRSVTSDGLAKLDTDIDDKDTPNIQTRFLIIHGKSIAEWGEALSPTTTAIHDCLNLKFGQIMHEHKSVTLIGGEVQEGDNSRWAKLPIVSLCSKDRHTEEPLSINNDHLRPDLSKVLDIHTFEAPIMTSNHDLTIDDIGLRDCTIGGILTLYAIMRNSGNSGSVKKPGKDGIFLESGCWQPPTEQSERGMAAFLSSLRVFTHLTSAEEMEQYKQNAVLEIMHCLTRFPPATRAAHILMDGRTPTSSECAAIGQAVFEVLKKFLPRPIIKHDQSRFLEGTRLFFGFLLDRAKRTEQTKNVKLPFFDAYKTLDLKDSITNEILEYPVQTEHGLVEKGYFEAFHNNGPLGRIGAEHVLEEMWIEPQFRRVAILSGSTLEEVSYYDFDALSSHLQKLGSNQYAQQVTQAFADLRFMASLCELTGLAVVPPTGLHSTKVPALTLDRDGLLAVYVGRPPCTQPPNDTAIYRPTKGGEVNVDVSIIVQLLEPILAEREQDGTSVFDLYGQGSKRKDQNPDEIIVFCVDCSRSMRKSSDFHELMLNDDDNPEDSQDAVDGLSADLGTFVNPLFQDMRDYIVRHESYHDMLAIVRSHHYDKKVQATKVIKFLITLLSRELSNVLDQLQRTNRWATLAYNQGRTGRSDARIDNFRRNIAGLNQHQELLSAFLVDKSSNTAIDSKWDWKFDDPLPKPTPALSQETKEFLASLNIPDDFLCPISREIMDDAVTATDGFTYDRKEIERWFQLNNTSPSTNLRLSILTLRRNGPLNIRIAEWADGRALIEQLSPPRKRHRSSSKSQNLVNIRFTTSALSFNRRVPPTLPVRDLYRLAFQGLRGLHSMFSLSMDGIALEPSAVHTPWSEYSVIQILVHDKESATSNELCLIKVYEDTKGSLFNYWVPKSTSQTVASVVFRHWRYNQENSRQWQPNDMDIWTDMSYGGDGTSLGFRRQHWNMLSSYLNGFNAVGSLQPEDLYSKSQPSLFSDHDDPAQKVLVLKLSLYRYVDPERQKKILDGKLSRLDVSKQIFGSYINRTLAYNYPVHMGLVTFQDSAKLSQAPSGIVEKFRRSIDNMTGSGDTALWDALALGLDQIEELAKKYPDAKRRIICLSDGIDTKSERSAFDVVKKLKSNNVVVDSFCLGTESNKQLRAVSYVTGGYIFAPKTLEEAMAICEMEPVLFQLERPPIIQHPCVNLSHFTRHASRYGDDFETVTRDVFPQRKHHPSLNDSFVQVTSLARTTQERSTALVSTDASRMNVRSTRLLSEIKNIASNVHPSYDVYVSESNMGFWKVVMKGPPESAYETGTFVLFLDMEGDYPAFPPKGRFITPIFHPNINRHGRICHSILDRNWTTDTTNCQVLNTVYSLLLVPEFTDPINTIVTLDFYWDEVQFREESSNHIARHATKTREQWKREILALDDADGDDQTTLAGTDNDASTYGSASATASTSGSRRGSRAYHDWQRGWS